jgi:DUF971 family protein
MKESPASTTPVRMDVFPSGEIGIVWKDGHESYYAARDLRCLCPCAACVDEVTGRRILDPATVPADLQPRLWNGVGHYGVQFVWSDGHSTGIYPHALLRRLCACAACVTREAPARGDDPA